MASKGEYEPVPDVEKGEGTAELSAKEKYPDFDEDQANLLSRMDAAMNMKIDLNLPKVSASDLKTEGQSFLAGMVFPTTTAVVTFAAALFVGTEAKSAGAGDWATILAILFPYINAIALFCASVPPIKQRFLDAVKPVYAQLGKVDEKVEDAVGKITPMVDTTVDGIQAQVGNVLEPVKPTLDKASSRLDMLKKLDPDIDIPDTSDIDREFDEAQGVVGAKVDEAKKHLDLDQYVPKVISTSDIFFWKVIFPVLLVALSLQLLAAFVTAYINSTTGASEAPARLLITVPEFKAPDVHIPSVNLTSLENFDYKERFSELEEGAGEDEEEFEEAVKSSHGLVICVAVAYVSAALQIMLVFFMTQGAVLAGFVNKAMSQKTAGVDRTLREYGVSGAMEDVMGTRMGRIRTKLMKILTVWKKVKGLMNKLGPIAGVADKAKDKMKDMKSQGSGLLGRFGLK